MPLCISRGKKAYDGGLAITKRLRFRLMIQDQIAGTAYVKARLLDLGTKEGPQFSGVQMDPGWTIFSKGIYYLSY